MGPRSHRGPCGRALVLALVLVASGVAPSCTSPPEAMDAGRDVVDARASLDVPREDARLEDAPGDVGVGLDAADGAAVVTTLRVRYAGRPGAITLRGGGGPLSWTTGAATTEEAGSVWVFRTTEITEPIEWKPVLGDAEWARGPNYHVAPGETIEVAPHFVPSAGTVTAFDPAFDSAHVAGPRIVWAYLPPGYDENTAARWPVIYVQDGQNLFDPARAFGGNEWRADETMDAAAEVGHCGAPSGPECANDGECAPLVRCETFRGAILVAPEASPARIDEYTPTLDPAYGGGMADDYLRALTLELAPAVNAALRTRTEPAHTGILGSSLGGLLAAHASVVRTDVFGLVGAMSPSTWWDGRVILGEVATIPTLPVRAQRVYVDSGDAGSSSDGVTDTAELAAAYRTAGYVEGADFHYLLAPGHEHNEVYWALRLPGALAFLLGPREERLAP